MTEGDAQCAGSAHDPGPELARSEQAVSRSAWGPQSLRSALMSSRDLAACDCLNVVAAMEPTRLFKRDAVARMAEMPPPLSAEELRAGGCSGLPRVGRAPFVTRTGACGSTLDGPLIRVAYRAWR
jgi:hypothetical protein